MDGRIKKGDIIRMVRSNTKPHQDQPFNTSPLVLPLTKSVVICQSTDPTEATELWLLSHPSLHPGSHIVPDLVVGEKGVGELPIDSALSYPLPWGCHVYVLSHHQQLPMNKTCHGIHERRPYC